MSEPGGTTREQCVGLPGGLCPGARCFPACVREVVGVTADGRYVDAQGNEVASDWDPEFVTDQGWQQLTGLDEFADELGVDLDDETEEMDEHGAAD